MSPCELVQDAPKHEGLQGKVSRQIDTLGGLQWDADCEEPLFVATKASNSAEFLLFSWAYAKLGSFGKSPILMYRYNMYIHIKCICFSQALVSLPQATAARGVCPRQPAEQ